MLDGWLVVALDYVERYAQDGWKSSIPSSSTFSPEMSRRLDGDLYKG